MCDCDYPLCTVTCRVVRSKHPDNKGNVPVDVYADCICCGPSVEHKMLLAASVGLHVGAVTVQPEQPCFYRFGKQVPAANRIR